MSFTTVAAAPTAIPTISVPTTGLLGVTTAAGIGLMLLVAGFWSLHLETGAARGWGAGQLDGWTKGKFDWRSFVYWMLGAAALTAILGSTGSSLAGIADWVQNKIVASDPLGFLGDIPKLIVCGILLYMAMRKGNTQKQNLIFGTLCAVALPTMVEVGAPGACVVMLFMAMKNKGDSGHDLYWGIGCGLVWPLGGGIWTEISLQIAHGMTEIVTWGAA